MTFALNIISQFNAVLPPKGSQEVACAFLGALLATLLPGLHSQARRHARSSRLSRYSAPLACLLLAVGARAAKDVVRGPYTVKLQRQEVPLHNENGFLQHKSAYYGRLRLGGPETQAFDVVFDTGSGQLVLPSAFCRSATCLKHQRYRRKRSQTARDVDVDGTPVLPGQPRDEITVAFGTGEVSGIFVEDELCLGAEGSTPGLAGERRDAGCLPLRVIAATEMSEDPFASFVFDGVLGLGLPGLSQAPEFNFVQMGFDAGAWGASAPGLEQAFSVFLGTGDEESDIAFGGFNEEHLLPGTDVRWAEVPDAEFGYWQVAIKGISVNGVPLNYCQDGCRAVVDTGTSLLGVPSDLGPRLHDLLFHEAVGDRCDGPGPRLELDLGNITLLLGPSDYARPRAFASSGVGASHFCLPMLAHMDLPEPLHPRTLILGEPVLQRYYTTFDAAGKRVGFGEALHAPLRV